jgi:hypothetical protein
MRRSIGCVLGGLMVVATVATPALAQGLNRSADLVSPQSGHADPGDLVMDINVTEALPNAFGGADLFGRRRPAGRTVVQYLGIENGTVYFSRQSTSISSNETTMTRTPLLIPRGRTFNGTTTASETTIVGPRPHSESQVGLAPLTIGVKVGEGLRAAGHELRVLRVYSDGSIDYAAR